MKNSSGRPFKLSIFVHSATLESGLGPGLVQNRRPYVVVRVGDKTKETELGDWSKERGQWCFKECITVEVIHHDEISVDLSCSTKYDLLFASVALSTSPIGGICFPVFAVVSRMKPEDRDDEGIVYATPVIPFDVRLEGKSTARAYLSFETNQPPPPGQKGGFRDQCCSCSSMQFGGPTSLRVDSSEGGVTGSAFDSIPTVSPWKMPMGSDGSTNSSSVVWNDHQSPKGASR